MARTRSYGRFGMASGVNSYRYALVPWTWDTSGDWSFWRLPTSAVGGVDLRPLPAQALAGGSPQGLAFAALMQSAGTLIATVPHMSEANATSAMQDAWEAEMGYRPQGAKLVDLLWDQITTGSDPSGENGPKPLMPGVDNVLRLFVPGHSQVKAEAFRFGIHPHTNRVRDLLRRDFERMWEESNGSDHCRRVLDFQCEQYRVNDWREFVPARLHAHIPGRLPHATTITDDFTRANQSNLGTASGGWSWGVVTGQIDISSNQAAGTGAGGTNSSSRAETDLSSDAHYAQVTQVSASIGSRNFSPAARFDAGATTYYLFAVMASGSGTYKRVTGTYTLITSATNDTNAGLVLKIECNGSTITGYKGGASAASSSDPSGITGNLRTGVQAERVNQIGDDFEAADLGGGAALRRYSMTLTGVG
jgi:hypothetical protein